MMLSLSLTACQTMASGGINYNVATVACKAFKPISWSSKDTRETQDQVVEHNSVYKEICK